MPDTDPGFRVVFVEPNLDPSSAPFRLSEASSHHLPIKVYNRQTATRYAANEVAKFPPARNMFAALINQSGRCVAVLGASGRAANPLTATRIKRVLATMPGMVVVRRRTSRPASARPAKAMKRRMTRRRAS